MHREGADLRRFPRIKSDVRVRAMSPAYAPAAESFGRGYDISEGGMGIYVPLELAPLQEILVVFDVPPTRQRLGVRAVVRYARGYRYGVEFQNLDERDRSELRRALEDLSVIQNFPTA